jgi:hypothetical protein
MFEYPQNPKELVRLLRLLRNSVLDVAHGLRGNAQKVASGVAAKFDQLAKDVEAQRITILLIDTEVTRALLRLAGANIIQVMAQVDSLLK